MWRCDWLADCHHEASNSDIFRLLQSCRFDVRSGSGRRPLLALNNARRALIHDRLFPRKLCILELQDGLHVCEVIGHGF